MRERKKQIIQKIYAIDNILDVIQAVKCDKFKVSMISNGEEVASFELIEKSKDQAHVGIIKQLKNRVRELEQEFKEL